MVELVNLEELSISDIKGISREEMRVIETRAYMRGIKPLDLMLKAGTGCAEYISTHYQPCRVIVLVSSSNNGGDGLVIADQLARASWDVSVFQLSSKSMRTEESRQVLNTLETNENVNLFQIVPPSQSVEEFPSPNSDLWKLKSVNELAEFIQASDLIVDSIFGINITTEIRSPYDIYLEMLTQIDSSKIISIDIPSGLDCNTANWHGPEFRPNLTLTMQYSKRALEKLDLRFELIDIGIHSDENYRTDGILFSHFFRIRDSDSHKGHNGRLMIIGGSDEYTGAPILSTKAALRMGVDTVRTVVPESIRDIVAGYSENFLITKVKGKYLTPKSLHYIYDLAMRRHESVVIGMGISNKQEVWKFVREFVKKVKNNLQLILDADGLRSFRGNNDLLYNTRAILTPHRAELRYFLNEEIPHQTQELVTFLENRAKQLQCTIVLKGKVDIITNGYRTVFNYTGHPGMTVGGTGDVLAGVIASVTCFVKDPFFAAAIGTYIMGKAGERSAAKYGNSLLATDIIKELPGVLMELEELRNEVMKNFM